jgi:hypothetical protein
MRGDGRLQYGGAKNNRGDENYESRRMQEQRATNYNRPQADFQRNRLEQSQGSTYQRMQDRFGGNGRENLNRDRENVRPEKDRMEGGKSNSRQKEVVICFWCREEGHHQVDCTNPPFCFRCKESGHLAARCPSNKGVSMLMRGFGFPGQGFYSLKLPNAGKPKPKMENVGLIRVKQGESSVEKMEEELKHLIDSKWQWEVKMVADREYIAIFPNKRILETFSRSSGFELALHKIVITVSPTDINPAVSSKLQEGLVMMYNIPDEAKSVDAVTAIAELAGEVVVVDEVSLIKVGPARVKIRARDIEKVRGFVEVFIEGEGVDIKFVPEMTKKKTTKETQPEHDHKTDDEGCGDEEEEDDLYDFDDDPTRELQRPGGGDELWETK